MEFKKEELIKSPLNYTGGKFKLLPQLLPLFPDKIDTFVDLFGGGFNVGINVNCNDIIYNDILTYLVDMFKEMNENSNKILDKIKQLIKVYDLNKENTNGFLKLRKNYNKTKNSIELYVLASYSFNYQLRFNNSLNYNSSFGRNRSSFNTNMEKRLIKFLKIMDNKNITFHNQDFSFVKNINLDENDLVYVDCPYLISQASYNDGKRGFGDWKEENERDLLATLDHLNKNNVKFALSNVLEHKGNTNEILLEWSAQYNVHFLEKDYNNCSYHGKNINKETIEVLITNY